MVIPSGGVTRIWFPETIGRIRRAEQLDCLRRKENLHERLHPDMPFEQLLDQ